MNPKLAVRGFHQIVKYLASKQPDSLILIGSLGPKALNYESFAGKGKGLGSFRNYPMYSGAASDSGLLKEVAEAALYGAFIGFRA